MQSKPGSILPPDIREQAEQSGRRGGIGSRAHENAATARQREAALNPDTVDEAPKGAAEPVREELKICPNTRCRTKLDDEWQHCAKCGADLVRGGAAKRLGIEFTEQDLQTYVFKGFVVRELSVLGKFKMTVKTSQAADVRDMDNYIVNGQWAKNADGSQRSISEFYIKQINQLAITAACTMKFNGDSIGETLDQRMMWLQEKGAALLDLLSLRVQLFNQAFTEFLNRSDSFSGS